jgi:hypothetical protein
MRGTLRACPKALRLDDVLATNDLVLFSLDVAGGGHVRLRHRFASGRTCGEAEAVLGQD